MNEIIAFLKEHAALLAALAAIAGMIYPGINLILKLRRSRDQIDSLHEKIDERTKALGKAEEAAAQANADLNQATLNLESRIRSKEELNHELSRQLEESKEKIVAHDQKLRNQQNSISKMLKLEGRFWNQKPRKAVPKFRRLLDRNMAIISVFNLKGGVGKTTCCANLAAAFVERGYRVLMLDLDLQGSLSSMFLPPDLVAERAKAKRLMNDFLRSAANGRKMNLLPFLEPVLEDSGSAIAATSDLMAYAELNLTMQWMLRLGNKDTRFLLRRALHQRRIQRRFDVVLIDCPPLINTCCVNALAASDYVLTPVTPSRKVAERVTKLLHNLHELKSVINPHLQMLGMFLNRTYSWSTTALERELWQTLQQQCQDIGQPVHAFKTLIPQTTEVRDNETVFGSPEKGSDLNKSFGKLLIEMEERLPGECRRIPTASN